MTGPMIAALRKLGRNDVADHIFDLSVGLSVREQALWEYYDRSGKGYGARSYIEHALAPLYAWELTEINKTEVKP